MKNQTYTLLVLLCTVVSLHAQKVEWGFKPGYLNAYGRVTEDSGSASVSEGGFFLGTFAKFDITDHIVLVPEIDYGNINGSGFGYLSLMCGYYLLPKVRAEMGPQLSYLLEATSDDIHKLGLDLGFGLNYDITDHFALSARYGTELSNRVNTPESADVTARFSWLFVGFGYNF